MQVFKLYFKILNKYKGKIFMYVGIFMGLLMGVIIPNSEKQSPNDFTESTTKYAIFDYDQSTLSKGVGKYLSDIHEEKELSSDDAETIQDALYHMEVSCVVKILEGYEEAFLRGEGDAYIEVYRIPGLSMAVLFEEDLKSHIKIIHTYVLAGYDVGEALEKTNSAEKNTIEVSLPTGTKVKEQGVVHWYFAYQPWIFIAMCVCALAPVLGVLNKKMVRERIECSSYKFSKMNGEIILAVITTGLGICSVFIVVAILGFGSELTFMQKLLYSGNLICLMMVALAITFLISKITDKDALISLFANVISLGMAFLTGVFVPMELLNNTVIKIAHFLPSFWYEKAVMGIDNYTRDIPVEILQYMGIQLLFAVAIIMTGLIVSKRKRMV